MDSATRTHAIPFIRRISAWTMIGLTSIVLNACTLPWQSHSTSGSAHWSYSGLSGPAYWANLDAKNIACLNGYEQSPIDIHLSHLEPTVEVKPFQLNYQPLQVGLINNGHTIQANVKNKGNLFILQDQSFELKQFHFHRPSEHQFNGEAFEMEVHFVHQNEAGKLAVLGVMIQVGAEHNLILDELFTKLPVKQSEEEVVLEQTIDVDAMLPLDRRSVRYHGSLTTPPCSEGVLWTVMVNPIELSSDQVEAYQSIYAMNSRPVQPRKWRAIYTESLGVGEYLELRGPKPLDVGASSDSLLDFESDSSSDPSSDSSSNDTSHQGENHSGH